LKPSGLEQRNRLRPGGCQEVGYLQRVLKELMASPPGRRQAGTPPECPDDYFPDDWLLGWRSHVTVPSCTPCSRGPARKKVLIDHGFPAAPAPPDNGVARPRLSGKSHQTIFVSATRPPGSWSRVLARWPSRLIRPTGVSIRFVEVRPQCGPGDGLLGEIRRSGERQETACLITPSPSGWPRISTDYCREWGASPRICTRRSTRFERIGIIQGFSANGLFLMPLFGVKPVREGSPAGGFSLVASRFAGTKEGDSAGPSAP